MAHTVTALRIAAFREGYRRCGRAFSKTVRDYALTDFTKTQIATLKKDRGLKVTEVKLESAPPSGGAEAPKGPAAAAAPKAEKVTTGGTKG